VPLTNSPEAADAHERRPNRPQPAVPAGARQLTSILGVLRRPQTTADCNPALIGQLSRGAHSKYTLGFEGRPVLSLMRLATIAPWGQRIYVVPFLAPTTQAKKRLPRKDQGVTVASTAGLATYPVTGGDGVPAEIEGGRDIANADYAHGEKPGSRWVMVVPDGVAKVALWPATRSIAHHPRHLTTPGSRPIIVTVDNNIAAFRAPGFHAPGQEIWYRSNGTVVKRIDNADSCGPPLGNCA
jgi:hypothetical protein